MYKGFGNSGLARNDLRQVSEGTEPELMVPVNYFPTHCMHCANPPCVKACPRHAIVRQEHGVVLINKDECNACADQPGGANRCIKACLYQAIQFDKEQGVVDSCMLCVYRNEAGFDPACVKICLGNALTFGDFNDPDSEVSKKAKAAGDTVCVLRPDRKTNPGVRYIRPRQFGSDGKFSLDNSRKLCRYM